MTTNRVINNLTTLLAAVEAQPETLFDLQQFKQTKPCGTIFCTVGLAATMPHFTEQGLGLTQYYPGTDGGYYVSLNGMHMCEDENEEALEAMFGPEAFEHLFQPAGEGMKDAAYGLEQTFDDWEDEVIDSNMTDKQLAVVRLQQRIKELA